MVPAAKRVGADLLEFVALENADVVSGGTYFKRAKNKERKTLKNQLGSGSRKRIAKTASIVIPTKSAKQINW